jgi:hypothetical protein
LACAYNVHRDRPVHLFELESWKSTAISLNFESSFKLPS